MYNLARDVLVCDFWKPQMVLNAHLKRINSVSPMQLYHGAAWLNWAKILLSCLYHLTQFNYVGHLTSEKVLGNAAKKNNSSHENAVADLCQANETVSTWFCCVR